MICLHAIRSAMCTDTSSLWVSTWLKLDEAATWSNKQHNRHKQTHIHYIHRAAIRSSRLHLFEKLLIINTTHLCVLFIHTHAHLMRSKIRQTMRQLHISVNQQGAWQIHNPVNSKSGWWYLIHMCPALLSPQKWNGSLVTWWHRNQRHKIHSIKVQMLCTVSQEFYLKHAH